MAEHKLQLIISLFALRSYPFNYIFFEIGNVGRAVKKLHSRRDLGASALRWATTARVTLFLRHYAVSLLHAGSPHPPAVCVAQLALDTSTTISPLSTLDA